MSVSYYNIILPIIKDKTVLDIGSISHSFDERSSYKDWNFDIFLDHAKFLKGIDILEDDILKARQEGYDIISGNAETFISENKFDVVFAGDLIEHLANPGLFLQCSYKNLNDDGVLVIVTPNAFSLSNIFKTIIKLTNEPPVNPEHTFYFTPRTISELARRENFKIEHLYYSNTNYNNQKLNSIRKEKPLLYIQMKINYFLTSFLPHFSQALILVLSKKI
jgi:2-polyprenyl-3-methyl-5-hydroxy-6-metoxy-1,4-benzoquinol methylase